MSSTNPSSSAAKNSVGIDVFETELGWFGVQWDDRVLSRLKFGFESSDQALLSLGLTGYVASTRQEICERLVAYAQGQFVTFEDVEIDVSWMTPFQRRVIEACREIPRGGTVSYQQLASAVGSPGAARAVGSVMRTNRVPIIVPCHRVLRSDALGQYSASRGMESKRRLLQLEGAIETPAQASLFDD